MHRFLLLLACALAPLPAQALFTPENGFYWTPGQGGTGVAVEVQNQFLFVTGYVYDTTGRATFVSIQGPLTRTSGDSWLLDTTLFVSSNGRCIGSATACPYRAPNTVAGGSARVEFPAPNILLLRWSQSAGVQDLTLLRFDYFTGTELQSLLGEWDVLVDRFQANGVFLFSGEKLQLETEGNGTLAGCTTAIEGDDACSSQRVSLTRTTQGLGSTYALGVGLTNGDLFQRVIAFSPGFVLPIDPHASPHIFISHGTRDEILPIDQCSRRIVPQLQQARYDVQYKEFDGPHAVPPEIARQAVDWIKG